MKLITISIFLIFSIQSLKAQSITGSEFGIDATLYFSTNDGSVGFGAKYGIKTSENVIFGPSFRYQRSWTNNSTTGTKSGYNVFGGGAFFHYRFFHYFFAGTEFEMLNSPYTTSGQISFQKNWVPTLFVGGGLSMNITETIHLNVSLMYDILDKPDSPLRTQYFLRTQNNVLLPIIYRFAFFFEI